MDIDINVLVALLSGGTTLIVCLVNNHFQNERVREETASHYDKTNALLEYKLTELTKKVELHNNVVERVYGLEKSTSILDERVRMINSKVEDLERSDDGK